MKVVTLLAMAGACAILGVAATAWRPLIVWNASRSVPIGLYRVQAEAPGRDDLALVRLAPDLAGLAHRRDYLHGTDYALKPVAAIAGDTVCRFGLTIIVRGAVAALARQHDSSGRPMPVWQGCQIPKPGDLFLLSTPPDSFDSRYFGPVAEAQVIGAAQPIWIVQNSAE